MTSGKARSNSEGSPSHIGPYPVTKKLDEGGFGEVFLAEQTSLGGRVVCIKRAHARNLANDDGRFLRMFLEETELAGRLSHENIVSVIDAGQDDDGLPYFVMEFVKGTNVAKLLHKMRPHGLGPDHTAYVLVNTAKALAYAHSQAVIHRDIKPANLLISQTGGVKLGDFGIAKIQQGGAFAATSTRTFVGSHPYMAPEQLAFLDPGTGAEASIQLDHRVDLWALGVMGWECLCGFRPFEDEVLSPLGNRDRLHWLFSNIRGLKRRDIHDVRPDAPEALLDLLEELLQPLDQRINTADEVLHRLIDADLGLPTHRKIFVRQLIVKDTLEEHPAYKPPEAAEPAKGSGPAPRPISPATLAEAAPALEPAHQATAPLPTTVELVATPEQAASPSPSSPERPSGQPTSPRRPMLVAALGVSVGVLFVLLVLVAGVGGFMFGAGDESAEPASGTLPSPPGAEASGASGQTRSRPRTPPGPSILVDSSEPIDAEDRSEPDAEQGEPERIEPRDTVELAELNGPHSDSEIDTSGGGEVTGNTTTPVVPERSRPARVTVGARPFGNIWIDGRARGPGPVTTRLSPGTHRFSAGRSAPTVHRRVRLRSGERRDIVLEVR